MLFSNIYDGLKGMYLLALYSLNQLPHNWVCQCCTRLSHTDIFVLNKSFMAEWLDCCAAFKTVLKMQGPVPGSQLKVHSAFHSSKVSKLSTKLAGGGGNV